MFLLDKNEKCNSQVYLNMITHTFFLVCILLGFPLMLKTEKKYHSEVVSNTGSCSVKRVDYTKRVGLKREQLVHLLNMFILVCTNDKI